MRTARRRIRIAEMADIALIWDSANGRADFAIANGDIVMDDGLRTALILSLFCDRVADPSDVIPDGSGNPRGWWGDTPTDGSPIDSTGLDLTGSKLWQLVNALQTQDTLNQAQAIVADATRWLVTDGIADSVVCVARYPARGQIEISIGIEQGQTASVYDFAWSNT